MDLQVLQRPLSAGILMGDQGSTRTIQAINSLYNTTGAAVYSEAGQAHYDMVQQSITNIVRKLVTANDMLRSITDYRAITEPDQLCYVPETMWLPILTMPEIRELHQAGKIYGFGVPVDAVPQEDVYGRLINNGRVEIVGYKDNPDEIYQEWTMYTDDPELSWSDLDNIEASRNFIRGMLAEQSRSGDQLDPTDYPNKFIDVKIK